MGTKMPSTYASLTIVYLEEKFDKNLMTKYEEYIKIQFTKSWMRYFHDCSSSGNPHGEILMNYTIFFKTYNRRLNSAKKLDLANYCS